jgi:hypothetical protein
MQSSNSPIQKNADEASAAQAFSPNIEQATVANAGNQGANNGEQKPNKAFCELALDLDRAFEGPSFEDLPHGIRLETYKAAFP